VGVVAAAGLVALEKGPARLHEDHANARFLADQLAGLPGVQLDPEKVQTNIVIYGVAAVGMDSGSFLEEIQRRGVLGVPVDRNRVRMVTHRDVDRSSVERAVEAVGEVMREKAK
jgi:threonine aldolase